MEDDARAEGISGEEAERREMPRCTVDEAATLVLVSHGSSFPGRLLELSLSGCRMQLRERLPEGLQAQVEAVFRVRGIAFRLKGELQRSDGLHMAGVCFGAMSLRRRDELMKVLCEVEAENAARAEVKPAEAVPPAEAQADAGRGDQERGRKLTERQIEARRRPEEHSEPAAAEPAKAAKRRPRLLEFLWRMVLRGPLASAGKGLIPAAGTSGLDALNPEERIAAKDMAVGMGESSSPALRPSVAAESSHPRVPEQRPGGGAVLRHAGRERRADARFGVETLAFIHLVKVGSRVKGSVLDLSLGGCRIRTDDRFPVGIYTRVEVEFQLEGLPFLLGGVIQAIHDRQVVGIRFLDVSARKREQLQQLVGEIEEKRAKQATTQAEDACGEAGAG